MASESWHNMAQHEADLTMAIHTFGEYLDFHPHLHALVADGLFVRSRLFYVLYAERASPAIPLDHEPMGALPTSWPERMGARENEN
jgi:hypothetical protein